jgi:hypothetical protein
MTLPGIRPQEIAYDLHPVAPEHAERPDLTVANPEQRFEAKFPGHLGNRTRRDTWDQAYRDIPAEMLAEVFSFDEMAKMWAGDCIMSKLSEHITQAHGVVNKVTHCHWRYGYAAKNYNRFVEHVSALRRLDWPGFDLRLVWTNRWSMQGWAEQDRSLYLDAGFGLLVYAGSKHVLTVGFAPSKHGVFIAQIQLRAKRGNRWLYRLGQHYVDAAVDVIARAFSNDPVWLVEGRSAAEAVRRSYGKNECKVTPEDMQRIASIYNRDLAGHWRTGEERMSEGRTYLRLRRNVALAA